MSQPPGFIHPDYPHYVWKLNKSLHGLKQAPQALFSKLSSKLLELDFSTFKADISVFTFVYSSLQIYLLVNVEDIVIIGSDDTAVDFLISTLKSDFSSKDLGRLHYFLSVEIHHSSSSILLTHHKYVEDLLLKTNMSSTKPIHTPMATTGQLSARDGSTFKDPTLFHSVVGIFQYLSFTPPDLLYAVKKSASKCIHRSSLASCQAHFALPSVYCSLWLFFCSILNSYFFRLLKCGLG